ncbi:MAG: hypothetical protein O3C17_23050 [Planctomycetota bacterium]|nr:hypothetical protein [Planctomycetota bacterium]
MDTEQLRQDVAEGTIEVDRLVDLIASQQKRIAQQQAEIDELKRQNEELKTQNEKNPTQRLDEAYSEKAEEERQAKAQGKPKPRKKPKRQGRITTLLSITTFWTFLREFSPFSHAGI